MLAQLPVMGSPVALREAVAEHVPALVQLLAADQLGSTRDGISTAACSLARPMSVSTASILRAIDGT